MANYKKERLREAFNYNSKEESRIVKGREMNALIDSLTDGTATNFKNDTIAVDTINPATAGGNVGFSTGLTSTSATAGVGYATGAGVAVTQSTSITTDVDGANGMSGTVTTVSATLAAGAEATFAVNNSSVAANDVVIVNIKSTASAGTPVAFVTAVDTGTFSVTLSNLHASAALDNTIVLSFAVIKAVAA